MVRVYCLCSVSKAAKTARVCLIRHAPLAASLYSLFIQNHYAKSGTLGFSERTPEACTNLSCGRFVLCGEQTTVDSRVCRIRFDPLFRLRHVFSSKMDSLAWLRYAGAGHANRRGGKSPAAIGKANAPTPKTSDSKFDSLRGKMLPHFILPESLIL